MATKKRKTTKKRTTTKRTKEAPVEHELPGGFWRQIVAVLMIALALFFVITWFGHGGSALNAVHGTIQKGIGLATYFVPALLVYLAIKIFRSENNRVAVPVYIASILMLLWISGVGAIWNYGGIVGDWLNGVFTQALDQAFVIIIYIYSFLSPHSSSFSFPPSPSSKAPKTSANAANPLVQTTRVPAKRKNSASSKSKSTPALAPKLPLPRSPLPALAFFINPPSRLCLSPPRLLKSLLPS